jgi:hypothetical protein
MISKRKTVSANHKTLLKALPEITIESIFRMTMTCPRKTLRVGAGVLS